MHEAAATTASGAKVAAASAAAATVGMTAAMLVGRVVLQNRGKRGRLRHLAKEVGRVAAQVEAKSGDVRKASAKAKLAAQMLA